MSIVLTPEFGPRNRFGVVLTTAEIEPDSMYNGSALCDPAKCTICTDCCPTDAISLYSSGDSHTCTLGEKTYTYAKVSFPRCEVPTQGLRREFGGTEDWVTTDNPEPKDILDANARMPISTRGLQHGESWHCGKCLSYCPVGQWSERFLGRALTGGLNADRWGKSNG
jgi:epoxyqueuosine reductase QueG